MPKLTNKELYAYVTARKLNGPPGHYAFDSNLMTASADDRAHIMFKCLQRAQNAGRPLESIAPLSVDEVNAINAIYKARS